MNWNINHSRQLYAVEGWGAGYFDIDDCGHVVVYPYGNQHRPGLSVAEIVSEIREQGLDTPVLVRFIDILRHRVSSLIDAFARARQEYEYQGDYHPIYPIKVNQQNSVVDAILSSNPSVVGLEAGSRAELLAIIALSQSGLIVCNGYKDRHYIQLALSAIQMGMNVFLVIEKLSELTLILEEADKMGVGPNLGVRIRLSSIGDHRWQNSGGEKSKFGLGVAQLLSVVEQLQQANRLHWLTMMHFHIGSQVTSIDSFKRALQEAGRFYADLHQLGADISTIDVGGGLAVDYEGNASDNFCSMSYSIDQYAQTIIGSIKHICQDYQLPEPDIMTESGRAMTAHHSVLITNVVDVEAIVGNDTQLIPSEADLSGLELQAEQLMKDMQQLRQLYADGSLSLKQLATREQDHIAQLKDIRDRLVAFNQLNDDSTHFGTEYMLNEKLADKVFCNFSLFQSMPDVWAFQQRFPIMPLSRLDEIPNRHGIIQDLTCDSDGCISHYVEQQGIESTLRLHEIDKDEPYYLGFFLLGAYQEILGDMHNLFGDVDTINVSVDGNGQTHYFLPDKGDTVADLLRYVHFEPEQILEQLQTKLDNAELEHDAKQQIAALFQSTLNSGTYLEQF